MGLGVSRRGGHAADRVTRVLDGEKLVGQSDLGGDFFCQEIATWCIVLMERMDANAIDRRLASVRNRLAECIVPFVADANPVECYKHDGFLFVGL